MSITTGFLINFNVLEGCKNMGSGYRNALVYPPPPHNRLGHFTVFINSMRTRCTYLYFKEPVSQDCRPLDSWKWRSYMEMSYANKQSCDTLLLKYLFWSNYDLVIFIRWERAIHKSWINYCYKFIYSINTSIISKIMFKNINLQ